jgi:hypothetical protein
MKAEPKLRNHFSPFLNLGRNSAETLGFECGGIFPGESRDPLVSSLTVGKMDPGFRWGATAAVNLRG